jgi:septal ring factor EnvC (AmiA/AmiB activator)
LIRGLARVVLVALAVAGGASAQQPRDAELRELRGRIEQLRKDLAASESARAEAVDQLRESETAISEANRSLRELARDRDRVRGELGWISSESQQLRADLEARRSQLARLLRAQYVQGDRGVLRVLLSGEDPQGVARQLVYAVHISRAQADVIRTTREDLARIATLEARARDHAAELAAVDAKARSERSALRAKAAERRQVLARMSGEIRKAQRDLDTAQKNEARLTRLIQELARAARPPLRPSAARPDAPVVGAFGGHKGRLRAPVRGELAARFGSPQQALSPSPKGVFFRAAAGEDVRAVAAGQVVFADWMRGYGNLLILDHGDGYLSVYGNNEAVLKRVGDAVHAGDVVATVGASGGNETSGLYFELRHQGRPFDPAPWLQSR